MSRDRNAERNAKIVAMRRKGMWPAQIAKELGISRNAVIGVCNRAGLSGDNGWKEVLRGEVHPHAKLTDAQVRDIRARHVPYVITQRMLAREYGVSRETINLILRGRSRAA